VISTNIGARAVLKFLFFLQDKALKEIHTILTKTIGEHATSYATVKNWVATLIAVILCIVSSWTTKNIDLPGAY
jgi:hypothetical protein